MTSSSGVTSSVGQSVGSFTLFAKTLMHTSGLFGQSGSFLGLTSAFVASLGSLTQVLCALHFRAGEKCPLGLARCCKLFFDSFFRRFSRRQCIQIFFTARCEPSQFTLSILKSAVRRAHVRRTSPHCHSDVMLIARKECLDTTSGLGEVGELLTVGFQASEGNRNILDQPRREWWQRFAEQPGEIIRLEITHDLRSAELYQQFDERLVSRAETEERIINSHAVIACAAIDGVLADHRFEPFAIERHAILRH